MADRTRATKSRKRQRAQSEKDSPSVPSPVAAKRRRVDKTHDREPGLDVASTSPGLISTAINGALSLGRRIVSSGAHVSPTKKKPTKADAWEVPDSEEERTTAKPPPRKASSRKPKALPAPPKKASAAVYDVPESGDDELARTPVSHHTSRQKRNAGTGGQAKAKATTKSSQSALGKPGQTSKASLSEAQETDEPQDEVPAVDTPSKPRSIKKARTKIVPELISEGSEEEGQPPPSPLRNKDDSNQLSAPALKMKGILTPAKQEGIRRQKSVAFNSGKKADETFEEAVSKATESVSKPGRGRKKAAPKEKPKAVPKGQPKAAPQEKPKAAAKKQPKAVPKDDPSSPDKKDEEGEEDEEDEEVCTMCSKPDSKRGNEIVFCDSCDKGYHKKCHGLAAIPKGDWICRNCLQEDTTSLAVGQKPGTVVSRQEEIPVIPNFEQHLRTLQRVLLDRCAGRRRIKLRGQDEAYEKASQLVEQTIVAGEGNSMLVIGARGCGKTTVRTPPSARVKRS